MRVDFYVLGSAVPETIVAALAARALAEGQRLLVIEADEPRRRTLSEALWKARPEQFLANGLSGEPHAARQPVLLSDRPEPENGARLLCLADGQWREGEGFERVFYLVDEAALPEARRHWRRLGEVAGVERRFWKQDEPGRWVQGP
jgi:DNA polymerase-3 subunit chi